MGCRGAPHQDSTAGSALALGEARWFTPSLVLSIGIGVWGALGQGLSREMPQTPARLFWGVPGSSSRGCVAVAGTAPRWLRDPGANALRIRLNNLSQKCAGA